MQQSYTKNYFKIYFWQGVSLVLNFLSMFLIVPYLTADPITYGIYSVCISFSIFLAYADLGFMGAGQKYAAEYFARGEMEEEIKVIGFTIFILMIFLLLFSIGFVFLGMQPQFLVGGIKNVFHENLASSLFLILAISTPTTLLQRLFQMIFGIRMEDFIIQRINIFGSVLKIVSVLWFFGFGNYDMIGYFLFTQIINFLASLIMMYIAKKRYKYDFKFLFSSIHFNRLIFHKTKGLAIASLFITISWILYYELDTITIGKFLGADQVANYSIGLTVLAFFRSILGVFFSPLSVRFNHFIGQGDEGGLKLFYLQVVTVLAPFVVFPIITISILARSIVYTWVGSNYSESIIIIQLLVFCNVLAFISYPTNFMLIAKERQKELYLSNMILPFIFWIGVTMSIGVWGIKSFAVFKLISFLFSGGVLYLQMLDYFKLSFLNSIKKIFVPMIFPVLFLILSCFIVRDYLPLHKSKHNFFIVAVVMGLLITFSFVIQFFASLNWRKQINKTLDQLLNK